MGDHKEKEQEKVSTPEVSETPKEKSEPKVESKSEPTSEAPKVEDKSEDKKEDVIKSLQGQISKLQKELNEKTDVKKQLQSLIGEENPESDVDPVEALNTRLQSLEKELSESKSEIAKNNYIDGLDQPEAVKRHLKKIVKTSSEDLESVVAEELESVQDLLENLPPKATDSRPKGIGATTADTTNMDFVLNHPELFEKKS